MEVGSKKDEREFKYIQRTNDINYLIKKERIHSFYDWSREWGKVSVGLNNFIGTFNPFPETGFGIYKWNLFLEGNEYLRKVKTMDVHIVFHILKKNINNKNLSEGETSEFLECFGLFPSTKDCLNQMACKSGNRKQCEELCKKIIMGK